MRLVIVFTTLFGLSACDATNTPNPPPGVQVSGTVEVGVTGSF